MPLLGVQVSFGRIIRISEFGLRRALVPTRFFSCLPAYLWNLGFGASLCKTYSDCNDDGTNEQHVHSAGSGFGH